MKEDLSVYVEDMKLTNMIDISHKCCRVPIQAVAFAYLVKKSSFLKSFKMEAGSATNNFEVDMAFNKYVKTCSWN